MPYKMVVYTDGGCRNNGRRDATGAAAAVFMYRHGGSVSWTRLLPSNPVPTSQRAEITGIILALEQALKKWGSLDSAPDLDVTIHTDSRYAIACMTTWVYKWARNGWINSRGREVVNRDLIERASKLDDRLRELGDVEYVWIPRDDNEKADELCRGLLYD